MEFIFLFNVFAEIIYAQVDVNNNQFFPIFTPNPD